MPRDRKIATLIAFVYILEEVATDDAIATVQQLAKRERQEYYYELMLARWRHIRLFLPKLLQTISFGATEAGMPVVKALDFLAFL